MPPTTPYAIEVNTPRPTADRSLEDDVGVALGPVVINQIQEPLSGLVTAGRAARLPTPSQQIIDRRVAAARIQKTQLSRLSDGLPLRQLQLPRLYEAQLDQSSIEHLADAYVGELNG